MTRSALAPLKQRIAPRSGNEKVLRVAHISMQFSDTPDQQRRDANRVFKRGRQTNRRWITGTEAGGSAALHEILSEVAPQYGFRFFHPRGQDCWVAINERFLKKGGKTPRPKSGFEKTVDGQAKKFTDKGVAWVTYIDVEFGEITILATHYITKGRPDARDPYYRQFLEENRRIAKATGDLAREMGKGKAKVFHGGDQNIVDRVADTYLGEPLTSLWDELGKYENTGHGNIDVIGSYDKDGAVRGKSINALNDKRFHLHSDHLYVEGEFFVKMPLAA